MNSLDPCEMVRYFSDFLTEINLIINSIKQHTYQIVDVTIPCPKILQVYHSMASIISSTHQTYDNLKRIQSVMTGIVKARRNVGRQEQTLTPMQKRFRCRSEDAITSDQYQKKVKGDNNCDFSNEGASTSNQNKTIKRTNISSELKLLINNDADKQKEITDRKVNAREKSKQQDSKTVKYVTDRGIQSGDRPRPLMSMKKWLQQRIQKIIANNRASVSKIVEGNIECLRLVRSVKKQVLSKK